MGFWKAATVHDRIAKVVTMCSPSSFVHRHLLLGGRWGLVWVVRLLLVVYIFNSWLLIHMLYK